MHRPVEYQVAPIECLDMRRSAGAVCAFLLTLAQGQSLTFIRHDWPAPPGDIRGAALHGNRLYTWGAGLLEWIVPAGKRTVLGEGDFPEGGCLADVDGDGRLDFVAQEGAGLGNLVWRRAPNFEPVQIDSQVEMHDCSGAVLFGRRGLLMIQRYGQVRFYERPLRPSSARWPYQEVYSFYTASRQAGLVLYDVDADGFTDILSGNYWIRSPKDFALPWRLFAINTDHQTPDSATVRMGVVHLRGGSLGLAVAQGHMRPAKLSVFATPTDPVQLWKEYRLSEELDHPHGLAVADFDGDALEDIAVAEDAGPESRGWLFWNAGSGSFRQQPLETSTPLHTLVATDVNRDGRIDLIGVGRHSLVWWENRGQRRR